MSARGGRLDVLVLDARQRSALVCARSLGRRGLRVGAFDDEPAPAFRSRWVAVSGAAPDPAGDPDAYVDTLLELVDRHEPRVVLTAHDGSIDAIAARRSELEERTRVALAHGEALAAALDKERTLAVAARLGIATPRAVSADGRASLAEAVRVLGTPLVVKPARSWTTGATRRRTSRVVAGPGDLEAAVATASADGSPVLVQEFLPGRREAVWLLVADGRVRVRFAQVAHRMYPALGGSSVVRESIRPDPDLLAAAEALVVELGLDGFSEVEFRRDAAGRPVLMEINPRLTASLELGVLAGIDFPWLIYAWAAGLPFAAPSAYRVGVRMRWLGGDIRWLLESLTRPSGPDNASPAGALARFAGEFLRPQAYDYATAFDPGPALAATGGFFRRGLELAREARDDRRTTA